MDCLKAISEIKKNMPEKSITNAIKTADKILTSLSINEFPVPIVKILNDLGFTVLSTDIKKKNISGMIMISPDLKEPFGTDKVIAVEKSDSIGRQRFTLAHEFAHYLFDFQENTQPIFFNTYDIEKSNTEHEIVPSRFAAEFLMPNKLFLPRFNELKDMTYYEVVNQLVMDFNVTTKAVIKRFEELNIGLGENS